MNARLHADKRLCRRGFNLANKNKREKIMKKIIYLIPVAAVLATAWWSVKSPDKQDKQIVAKTIVQDDRQKLSQQYPTITKTVIKSVVLQPPVEAIPVEVFSRLPNSLRNTPLPESLEVDEQGHLVVNQLVRKLFDFYLTAIGEESLELIVARIKHQLSEELPESALVESVVILEGYLQYRNDVARILNQQNTLEVTGESQYQQLQLLQQTLIDARHQFLAADVIEAFYGEEDAYDSYMLASKAVSDDPELSVAQRQQALAELEQQAPDWLREQQQSANQLNVYRQQQQQLLEQEGSQSDVRELREQTFGIEAADRLAKLDEKREQWHSKLAEYHQQLGALLEGKSEGEADTSRQAQIGQLRQLYFDDNEIRRVDAIDRHKFDL